MVNAVSPLRPDKAGVGRIVCTCFAMTRIAFFGHDAADAAVRRRVQGFRDDGLDVIGFTMHRRNDHSVDWDNVDLGRTFDAAYAQRIASVFRGASRAAAQSEKLASADVIYARNLDMLATALLARRKAKLKTPVIYESLDVHRLLTRDDPIGFAFRRLEGALLKHTRRLVVSSPGFLTNHFEKHHRGRYTASVIENRLAAGANYGPRPTASVPAANALRVGWIGVLRCKRSLGLLIDAARNLGPAISIDLHGIPALMEIPDFHEQIKDVANIRFHDRYRSPEDLAAIYSNLDVIWAGDFMEAGYNSVWLLPNRLYEGGYYGVPPIAPASTQTAAWADARGVGFTLPEDLATTLPQLFAQLAADKAPIAERRARLLALPVSNFVAERGELARLIADTLGEHQPQPDQNRGRHAAE